MKLERAIKVGKNALDVCAHSYMTALAHGCKKDKEHEEWIGFLEIAQELLTKHVPVDAELFKNGDNPGRYRCAKCSTLICYEDDIDSDAIYCKGCGQRIVFPGQRIVFTKKEEEENE